MWKLRWLVCGILILICLLFIGCFPNNRSRTSGSGPVDLTPGFGAGDAEYITNQLLVRFKPGAKIDELLLPINGRIIKYNQKLDFYQIGFNKTNRLNIFEAIRTLKDSNLVYIAEPNFIYKADTVPDDPDYSKQWGLEKINGPAGWDSSTGSNTVTIAIVDTGIDNTHPDLTGKVTLGYNAINDSAGFPGDDHGHGTHCAGISAGIGNNSIGMAGVAWQCNLMAVKVLDSDGSGEVVDIAEGIVWAADNGADVEYELGETVIAGCSKMQWITPLVKMWWLSPPPVMVPNSMIIIIPLVTRASFRWGR